MQLHELKRKTKNRDEKLVGRGKKRGKTSGRGGKGQTARAGNKRRPELRDIIKKLPKNRGYRFKSIQKLFILPKGDLVSGGEKFSELRKRLNLKGKSAPIIQIKKIEAPMVTAAVFKILFTYSLSPKRQP